MLVRIVTSGNDETATSAGNGKVSPVPFIPPGLQQMQQLLQSQLAGFNPAQLQQLMQQQQQILSHHQVNKIYKGCALKPVLLHPKILNTYRYFI